jgi:hypothetical protein
MQFPVRACTGYVEKNKPTFQEMEDMALVLDRVVLKRDAGFIHVDGRDKDGEKIKLILDENKE